MLHDIFSVLTTPVVLGRKARRAVERLAFCELCHNDRLLKTINSALASENKSENKNEVSDLILQLQTDALQMLIGHAEPDRALIDFVLSPNEAKDPESSILYLYIKTKQLKSIVAARCTHAPYVHLQQRIDNLSKSYPTVISMLHKQIIAT